MVCVLCCTPLATRDAPPALPPLHQKRTQTPSLTQHHASSPPSPHHRPQHISELQTLARETGTSLGYVSGGGKDKQQQQQQDKQQQDKLGGGDGAALTPATA